MPAAWRTGPRLRLDTSDPVKRTTLKRKTWLRASKPIARGKVVAKQRGEPKEPKKPRRQIRPTNQARRAVSYDRNYGGPDGEHADRIRSLPCVCRGRSELPELACWGRTEAAHEDARGMGGRGGGWADQAPLCAFHHRESGERRTEQRAKFEARYKVNLRQVADDLAARYMVGLAKAWLAGELQPGYDLDALLGWVRRFCERGHESERPLALGQALDLFADVGPTHYETQAVERIIAAAMAEGRGC